MQRLLSWLAQAAAWSAPLVVGCAAAVVTAQLLSSTHDINSFGSRDDLAVSVAPRTDQGNSTTTTTTVYSSPGAISPAASSSVNDASPSDGAVRTPTTDPPQQPNPTGSIPTGHAPTSTIILRTTPSTTGASSSSTLPAAPNHPPVAVYDEASAKRGTMIRIDVLANDYDVDGDLDPLSVSVIGEPTGTAADPGSVVVRTRNGRDEIDYRAPLVTGEFSFSYQVCDTSFVCSTANVRIAVNPPSLDPPVGS